MNLIPGTIYTVKTIEQLTKDFGEPDYSGAWEKCPCVFADAMTVWCGTQVTAKSTTRIIEDGGRFMWNLHMMIEGYVTKRGNVAN